MRLLLALAVMVISNTALSQGTVIFQNRNICVSPRIDAPISYAPGGPAIPGKIDGTAHNAQGPFDWGGVNARAGLYGGPEGTSEEGLVLLNPVVGFRSGIAAGYVDVGSSSSRIVPNVGRGETGLFQIRAWDAGVPGVGSFDDAISLSQSRLVYVGKSELLHVANLGGPGIAPSGDDPGSPPAFPADLVGLNGFLLFPVGGDTSTSEPEPSSLVLGLRHHHRGHALDAPFLADSATRSATCVLCPEPRVPAARATHRKHVEQPT